MSLRFGVRAVFARAPREARMPVTTSFVISNADNTFEATAYISAYATYKKNALLEQPLDEITCDGIFGNMDGFFQPCPLFEVVLIDEFLRTNSIDPGREYFYENSTSTAVSKQRAEDGCNYKVMFKNVDDHFKRLCITKMDANRNLTRCCVLLLGIHLRPRGMPIPLALQPAQGRGSGNRPPRSSQYNSQAARGWGQRGSADSAGLDYLV